MNIELELRKATGMKAKAEPDRQTYLIRLLEAAQDLNDSQWEKLSTPAQNWINGATEAANKEQPLPELAAEESEPEPELIEEEQDVTEEPITTKAAKPKAAKKAAPKASASPKAAAASKKPASAKPAVAAKKEPKEDGIKFRIKRLVAADPEITVDAIISKLQKGGEKMSRLTVAAVRSETRHTLRVLKAEGKLKGVDI